MTDDLIPEEFWYRHPDTKANLRPFAYAHLPEHLQAFSRPVAELAYDMARRLPDDPELAAGLRELRRAKDCFVSCAVFNPVAVDALAQTEAGHTAERGDGHDSVRVLSVAEAATHTEPERGPWEWSWPVQAIVADSAKWDRFGDPKKFRIAESAIENLYAAGYVVADLDAGPAAVETAEILADPDTMGAVAEAEAEVAAGSRPIEHPFKVGDRLRMNLLPEDVGRQMAVTVTDVGVCGDDDDGDPCGELTVHFADPQTGQPDEAHAADFTLVEGA